MSAPAFRLTAGLLAGGKSSRMGRDKAGMHFFGVPLWMQQVQTLLKTGADEILISGRKDACYGSCGLTIVEDEVKNAGPLSGIASLLAAASHPLVLVLAVDMPHMTATFLRRLREECSGECGVVPEKGGFFEGLAAIFPKSAGVLAGRVLQTEDRSIQHFIQECSAQKAIRITRVSDDEAGLFKSLNSPSDLSITR